MVELNLSKGVYNFWKHINQKWEIFIAKNIQCYSSCCRHMFMGVKKGARHGAVLVDGAWADL